VQYEELKVGFEPTTCGLRNRCSTAELLQHLFFVFRFEPTSQFYRDYETAAQLQQLFINIKKLEENSNKRSLEEAYIILCFVAH
jgi:hypothetical protein